MEKQKKWGIFCAVLGIVFVMALFMSNSRLTDARLKNEKVQSEIAQIKAELNEKEAGDKYVPPDEVLDETQKAEASGDAKDLGEKVAGYQNAYFGIDVTKDRAAFDKNVDNLDACFADADKGARVPWYNGTLAGTWVFVGSGKFENAGKHVLWLCRDGNGQLLAYATGIYDSENKLFSNMHYEMSLSGSGSVDSSGEMPNDTDGEKKVNNIKDDIKKADVPIEPGLTGDKNEETGDVKDNQAWLKDQMTGGGQDED